MTASARAAISEPHGPRLAEHPLVDASSPFDERDAWVERARAEGLDHVGADLGDVGARYFEIRSSSFRESRAEAVDLVDGRLVDCDLANAAWSKVSLERVELVGCRLTGAVLGDGGLVDVQFRDCELGLASLRFARLTRVQFTGCRLVETDLGSIRLRDVLFDGCDLTAAQFSGADLARTRFAGCRLAGLGGLSALAGAELTFEDLMELAPTMAKELGIHVLRPEPAVD